jgi:hypothetical protein
VGRIKNGSLLIDNIKPGERAVEVVADGYSSRSDVVSVVEGELVTVSETLSVPEKPALQASKTSAAFSPKPRSSGATRWLPYALIGLSGAALAGTVVSWVWINSIEKDKDFQDYRARVGITNQGVDVCNQARNGFAYAAPESTEYQKFSAVQGMCARASTLEVLQFVFLGAAVVSGGIGAYLLFAQTAARPAEYEPHPSSPSSRLSLEPRVGQGLVGLNAAVAFY